MTAYKTNSSGSHVAHIKNCRSVFFQVFVTANNSLSAWVLQTIKIIKNPSTLTKAKKNGKFTQYVHTLTFITWPQYIHKFVNVQSPPPPPPQKKKKKRQNKRRNKKDKTRNKKEKKTNIRKPKCPGLKHKIPVKACPGVFKNSFTPAPKKKNKNNNNNTRKSKHPGYYQKPCETCSGIFRNTFPHPQQKMLQFKSHRARF